MKVAKISEESIKAVWEFADACELFLEKEKFSFKSPWENWEDLDDDDPERKEIAAIKSRLAVYEEIDEDKIDGRIVAYEYLRKKYALRLKHAIMTMKILLDNVQDPTSDTLDFYPSFYENHVAPEQ